MLCSNIPVQIIVKIIDFRTKQHVLDAIRLVPFKDQMTNTSGGLRMATQNVFNPYAGDRSNVTICTIYSANILMLFSLNHFLLLCVA